MANKLEKVLELLINENDKQASALLHEWFVEKAREIHNQLVEEDDSVLEDEHEDEVAAETFYEDGDEEEGDMDVEDAEMELDADMEDGDEEVKDGEGMDGYKAEELSATLHGLEDELDALKAEFAELMGDDYEEDSEEESEESEESEEDYEEDSEEDMDMEDMGDKEEPIEENIYDTEGEGSRDAEDFIGAGYGDMDGVYEGDEDDEMGLDEEFALDEDEFADLEESAMALLSTVPGKNSEAEVGAAAVKKLSVNTQSPVPQHKTEDRIAGEPVQRKSSEHNGFGMESAPATKIGNGAKSPINAEKKSKDPLTKVSRDGDSSAKLNQIEGGEGNMDSPVPTNKGKKSKV